MNENGEYMVETCAERELFLPNTVFNIKLSTGTHREEEMKRGEQKSMIDYKAVDEKLRKNVLDAKVVKGS